MTERIEGLVAKILTARELVINRGEDHGVKVGMRFAILNRQGADIVDPETGESLGSVEVPKTIVKITRVRGPLSVARTFRTYRTGGSSFGAALGLGLTGPTTRVETLKTDEQSAQEELEESESFVKTGDPAVQVLGEEFDDDSLS